MIDTFPNHNEVLEKSLNVLTSYAKAKSDPSQHIEDFKEKVICSYFLSFYLFFQKKRN